MNYIKNEKGYTLVAVLLIIAVVGIMTPPLINSVTSTTVQNQRTEQSVQLENFTDMGKEYFRNTIQMNIAPNGSETVLTSESMEGILVNIEDASFVELSTSSNKYMYKVGYEQIEEDGEYINIHYISKAYVNGAIHEEKEIIRLKHIDLVGGNNPGDNTPGDGNEDDEGGSDTPPGEEEEIDTGDGTPSNEGTIISTSGSCRDYDGTTPLILKGNEKCVITTSLDKPFVFQHPIILNGNPELTINGASIINGKVEINGNVRFSLNGKPHFADQVTISKGNAFRISITGSKVEGYNKFFENPPIKNNNGNGSNIFINGWGCDNRKNTSNCK